MTEKYYTGVGSRNTPEEIQQLIFYIALSLGPMGYTLRSGGAEGADKAFECGARKYPRIIYRPAGDRVTPDSGYINYYREDLWQEAMMRAEQVHPAWHRCSHYAKKLHARNVFQVLGSDLVTPSKFLICWTPDGVEQGSDCTIRTGGTGIAIRIASLFNVPVFNLRNHQSRERVLKGLDLTDALV